MSETTRLWYRMVNRLGLYQDPTPLTLDEALEEFRHAPEEQPRLVHPGRKTPVKKPRWRNEELDLLRELYPARSNVAIARQLNRSVKSVVSKAHHMGLKKTPKRLSEMGRENVSLRSDRRAQHAD